MRLHSNIVTRGTFALAIAVMASAATPQAADHFVTMTGNWSFSPSFLEIDVGDTVTWSNRDDFDDHDATSTNPNVPWSTGLVPPDEGVTLQFLATGTYPYRDSLYGTLGMTGTIVVKGGGTVTPTPATLTNAMALPDGAFRCTITNLTPSLATVVEFSTNLVDWEGVETNFPAGDSIEYTNAAAGLFPHSFYRCQQTP